MYVKCDITGFGIFEVVAVATERQALCSELFKTVVDLMMTYSTLLKRIMHWTWS